MRELSIRTRLILWDIALLLGIVLLLKLRGTNNEYYLIVGFTTVMIFSNCLRNHIAAYKLKGKIY